MCPRFDSGVPDSMDSGTVAELRVAADMARCGYEVFVPVGGKASCDLIGILDGTLQRFEVKSTSRSVNPCSWTVELRQKRPNRTSVTTKKFNATNSDILAIYIEPEDRVVYMQSSDMHDRTSVDVPKE